MFGSISQHRLHDCTLDLEDGRLEKASLFPLFDGAGTTRGLMLTSAESSDILLSTWRPELVERRWFRPMRLRLRRHDFSAAPEDLDLESLWHFDPWWELGDERYAGHSLMPALKETNIPGHDPALTRFWLHSTLGRVTWVATGEGEATDMQRYKPSRLRTAEENRRNARPARAAQRDRSTWRLRPFWT